MENLLAQTTVADDQTDPVPNGTEAIAALSIQQDGIDFNLENISYERTHRGWQSLLGITMRTQD